MDRETLKTKTIGVLMGGMSGERPVSLRSGRNCLRALLSTGYNAVEIDALEDVGRRMEAAGVEVAFLALHGRYGEDGTIQGLLEIMGIPYTGSGVLASALGMNKVSAKKVVTASGLPTPPYLEVAAGEDPTEAAARIESTLGLPVMLKPVQEGSSLGVSKCKTSAELAAALEAGLAEFGTMFAEKFVTGTEITVGVLDRGGRLEALPILQLVPKNEFYDYEAKYTEGMTEFILPAQARAAGISYEELVETILLTAGS